MSFPDFSTFAESNPGPYERQMGQMLAGLVKLFREHVSDSESNRHVLDLVQDCKRWSAGHAVFDEIRRRYHSAIDRADLNGQYQYAFEESCCQAVYNATCPLDAFDESSAFFVVPQAMALAKVLGLPLSAVDIALNSHPSAIEPS